MKQKIERKFFVFRILAFQLGVANSHNIELDTCHWQSMCSQTPLRFHVTLGETFSKSAINKILKKHGKSTIMEISQLFWTLSHVHSLRVFRNDASYRVV